MDAIVDGQEVKIEMDFDAVVQYEDAHPDWSIVDLISHAASSKRISDLNLLTSFLMINGQNLGSDYVSCLRNGLKIDDMLSAFREGLTLLGFISVADQSTE